MTDDRDLLRQYVQRNSQAAFGRLVDEHMKLVYWTCRRDIRDAQLAEDAAQTVFYLLARKASALKPGVSLTGWLFNTSRLVARNMARGERRRRNLEEGARLAMQHHTEREAGWQQIEPWINDALSHLSSSDREIVLWRYVYEADFADIASRLGATEPAARKRVFRAVERLRAYVTKRGVALTSATLAALLAEHSAKAAPIDCRATALQAVKSAAVAKHALPALNPLIAKGIFIMSTTKIVAGAAVAVVLLLGLTFYAYHKAHALPSGVVWQAPPVSQGMPSSQLTWNAPPASDPATQQAQQQIQADLVQFDEGLVAGKAQQMMAVYLPGAPSEGANHMSPQMISQMASQPIRIAQNTVTSCHITGNTATVTMSGRWLATNPDGWLAGVDGSWRWSLTNSHGKWLISGVYF